MVYWYELTARGYTLGTQPRGQVDWEPSRVNSQGKDYGAVAYTHELSEKEIFEYDLKAIDPVRSIA